MIQIDGSSGGGQILRTAVALSAATGKDVTIKNMRSNRAKPGLRPQHMTGILAAAEMCGAKVKGATVGSQKLVFKSGKIKSGKFKYDVGTAGAVTLVLQTLIPVAAFAPGEVKLKVTGGTDVNWSPSMDYFQHVFCHTLKNMGLEIRSKTTKRGFFPKGGGVIEVEVKPWKRKVKFDEVKQGKLEKVDVWSIAEDKLKKAKVAERQVKGFKRKFGEKVNKANILYERAHSVGTSFHAHAHYSNCVLGAVELGQRGKKAEKVGEEAADKLAAEMKSGATLDHKMADQIILFLAFSGGRFKTSRISNHIKTSIQVAEKFLDVKFKVDEKKNVVEVQ